MVQHMTVTDFLRLNHYPPSINPDQLGVGEHSDYGCITILAQVSISLSFLFLIFFLKDDRGGLQVRPSNGTQYLDATPIEGAFVINIGDCLQVSEKIFFFSFRNEEKQTKRETENAKKKL